MNEIATSLRKQSGGRHALLLWLALAALFLQSLVTQTHIHLSSGSVPTAARSQVASTGLSFERSAPAGHSSCPLCVELKFAGHYLPPTPVALIAPMAFRYWFDHLAAVLPNRPPPTHHWQSRAPPAASQF